MEINNYQFLFDALLVVMVIFVFLGAGGLKHDVENLKKKVDELCKESKIRPLAED